MPTDPPPPLKPDFPPGFSRLLVGVGSQPFQFEMPGLDGDGNAGHYVCKHNPIEAATNPEAIYPDHSNITHNQWATAMQIKMASMSFLWQIYTTLLHPELTQIAGSSIHGGNSGTWPVAPL